jgi:hypothetical protein
LKTELEHHRHIANFQITLGIISALFLAMLGYLVYGPDSAKSLALAAAIVFLFVGTVSFLSFNNILENLEKGAA